MTAWIERRYAVVDVEGNGRQPPDLVELAVVPITYGIIGRPLTWLFQPDQSITAMARRIHGISNDMVADAPVFASLATDVQAHLDDTVLVAHNASVDLGVLKRKLPGFTPGNARPPYVNGPAADCDIKHLKYLRCPAYAAISRFRLRAPGQAIPEARSCCP